MLLLKTAIELWMSFFGQYGIHFALGLAFVMGLNEHRKYCKERKQGMWPVSGRWFG